MEFMSMVISSVKNLLGKKEVKEIIKYLATATIQHAYNKFNVNQYKYDPTDLKTMVYNHNLNNNDKININDINGTIDLLNIKRFIDELNQNVTLDDVMAEIAKLMNDQEVMNNYQNIIDSDILNRIDRDVLETTSIADSYEINSGNIYVPNRDIYTMTDVGNELANAKNDYLEQRMHVGNIISEKQLKSLLDNYYKRINYNDMMNYYRN